jgi:RNA polymerase sigma factor (sigma-70 family)
VVHEASVTIRQDPSAALEDVWREHGGRLWRSLVAYAGDPDVASDAMAEAFAQALGRGTELRDPARWVWRASFRIASGELRRRRRQPTTLAPSAFAVPESVADLVTALRALSPNQRGAAILRWYADLPTREVARILGCSPATVRVHLSQARRRLRPLLEDDDG